MSENNKTLKERLTSWPAAVVLTTFILVLGVPAAYLAIRAATAPGRAVASLSHAAVEAVRPKVTVKNLVFTSLNDLRKENKLVVFSADIAVDVTREEGTTAWGIYWGTNVARVAVKSSRVQYVIDLDKLETSDFIYHEQEKLLSVTFPRPHVDTTMVSIDPAQIMTLDLRGGWARFDKQDTKERALAELRPSIILEASKPAYQELAQSRGIEAATRLLQPMADALREDGATVRVTYRP